MGGPPRYLYTSWLCLSRSQPPLRRPASKPPAQATHPRAKEREQGGRERGEGEGEGRVEEGEGGVHLLFVFLSISRRIFFS